MKSLLHYCPRTNSTGRWLLILFSLSLPASVTATNYYVDADNGNNAWSGTFADPQPSGCVTSCTDGPWLTIDQVNSETFVPADQILFRRDGIWHGQLDITDSGAPGSPITFGSYGNGTSNPLIMRTETPPWWQDSDADGGFERFTGDTSTPNFLFPWREGRGTGALLTADANEAFLGQYAARLERQTSGSGTPIVLMNKGLAKDTQYYVRLFSKTADLAFTPGVSPQILDIRVRDANSTSGDRYWNPSLPGWSPTVTSITTIGSENYQSHNFTFMTDSQIDRIEIQFAIRTGTGIAWIDEVLVTPGSAEPTATVWKSEFSDVNKVFGMLDAGDRIPVRTGITNQSELNDREFWYKSGSFYYRKDSGNLLNTDVGRYMNSIRLFLNDAMGNPVASGVHDVVIDGIDVKGPGSRIGFTEDGEAGAGIFITPGSHDITVQNLKASHTHTSGVSAGFFQGTPSIFSGISNPYAIVYENLVTHDTGSTGLYLRGSGRVSNSLVYDVGRLQLDIGDRGGIGVQEGPAIIEDNEIHSLGFGDTKLDFAISTCCFVQGRLTIRRNHIHDVSGGGIQLDNAGQIATNFGHIVEYNLINRWGENSTVEATSYGQFAGLRIRNFPGTVIRNNVFANGGSHFRSKSVVLRDDVQNTQMHNNVFLDNQQTDFRFVFGADFTGWSSDNNLWSRADYTDAWQIESDTPDTLSEWQSLSSQDSDSIVADPLFIDKANDDFHLTAHSPAIELGISSGQLLDLELQTLLGVPDIGVYEYGHLDTDNDGSSDYVERCHDGDCVNYDPYAAVGNPTGSDLDVNAPDTDGDGYTDTAEIAAGSDPLSFASIPVIAAPSLGIKAMITLLASFLVLGAFRIKKLRGQYGP